LGHAKAWHAWFLFRVGRAREALLLGDESLAEVRPLGDLLAHAQALNTLGMGYLITGQFAQAERYLAEALALQHPDPRNWDLILATSGMGLVALAQGKTQEAYALTDRAVALYRGLGNPRMGSFALMYKGEVALLAGRIDDAGAALREGLELSRQIGDRYLIGNTMRTLGLVMLAQGQTAEAECAVRQSLAIFEETGDPWGIAHAMRDLGRVLLQANRLTEARDALLASLDISLAAHPGQFTLDALALLAQVSAAQGDRAEAATIAAHVVHSPISSEATRRQSSRLLAELTGQRAGEINTEINTEMQPDRVAAAAPGALDRLIAGLVASCTAS
jgi:tetratricopeptide (TPR) repeat protein